MPDTLTVVATPAQEAFVATAGRLPVVYVVNGTGVAQAITVDPLDYGLVANAVNVDCALAPDGCRVLYGISDGSLGNFVVKLAELNSATPASILNSEGAERFKTPAWHPDSQQMAFAKLTPDPDGGQPRGELILLSLAAGSNATRVYGDDVLEVYGFSPDGSQIYIARQNPEPFAPRLFSSITIANSNIKDIEFDRTIEGEEYRLLEFQHFTSGGNDRALFVLSESPYLQGNKPTPLRVAEAGSGATLATINFDKSISGVRVSGDGTLAAFTVRDFNDQTQVTGCGIWVAKLDGSEAPRNILPTQDEVIELSVVAWQADNAGLFVLSGPATLEQISLDGSRQILINQVDAEGAAIGHFTPDGSVTAFAAGGNAEVLLNVPYIHQLRDTPDDFNGNWACGPTSAVMLLAAYGLLDQRNDVCGGKPSPYGFYVGRQYTNKSGVTFSRTQSDPSGRAAAGGYGACTNNGEAWGNLVAQFVKNHGLGSTTSSPSEDGVKASLRQNKPVVLGTTIKGFGHVVLVKGITNDGKLICNDPYWRKPGGPDDVYAWWQLGFCPFMVTVDRPLPDNSSSSRTNDFRDITDGVPGIVGAGLGFSQQKRFVDAFRRNGGLGIVGNPAGNPAQIAPPGNLRIVQDFAGGQLGQVLMVLDDQHDQPNAQPVPILQPAFVIRSPILRMYRDVYKGSGGPLGSVLSDEFTNLSGQRQVNFEGGYIIWDPGQPEATGAFLWPDTFNSWKAEYYNNAGLAGLPSYIRDEQQINYDWRTAGPEGGKLGISGAYFSVRWTRTVNFDPGVYTLSVLCDDGFRLLVNGTTVVGADPNMYWKISAPARHNFNVNLNGPTPLVLEFFQWEGGATITLDWQKIE